MLKHAFGRLRHRFVLRPGTDFKGTVQRVTDGASLTSENLWLLACSSILASIGLDLSSSAVIIGAMLISPLMGPIMGVGLGLGTTNRGLLQHSLRELLLATIFTIAVSAAYFILSPLGLPTSEMAARTHPTLLDVGVAFFGGVAGIVAASRKNQSMALPGVAIATALMPPLCTAGFGLGTGNWTFFVRAFYLFSLNAVFISLSTFLIVRMLRFPHHEEASDDERRQERRLVVAVALLAAVPSAYFLVATVRTVKENSRISEFIEKEVIGPGRIVPQWERKKKPTGDVLSILVAGHPLKPETIKGLHSALPKYGLPAMKLDIVQGDVSAEDLEQYEGVMRRDLLRVLSATLSARDSVQAAKAAADSARLPDLAKQLSSTFPEITAITYTQNAELLAPDSVPGAPEMHLAFARSASTALRRSIVTRAQAFVSESLGSDSVKVIGK